MAAYQDQEVVSYVKKVLIVIGLVILAGVLVYAVRGSLTIVLLIYAGVILGVLLNRSTCWLARRSRLPAGITLTILLALLVMAIGLLLTLLFPVVVAQTSALWEKVPDAVEKFRYAALKYQWGEILFKKTDNPEELLLGVGREDMLKTLRGLAGFFSITAGVLMGGLFVFVIGAYMAADMPLYFTGTIRLLPPAYRRKGAEVLHRMGEVICWWLLGQCISMAVLGCVVFAGLRLLGMPFALLFALLTALMTFIPNLGPMLAFFPIGVVALAEEPPKLVLVAVFYILVQSLEGLVLTPLIHRKMITLPPALVIAVQILLLQLVGLVGVILAMPLVACAIVAVQSIYTEEILGDPRQGPEAAPACGRADGG